LDIGCPRQKDFGIVCAERKFSDFPICISKYGIDAIPAFADALIACQQSSDASITGGNLPKEQKGRFST